MTQSKLYIDIETFSPTDLTKTGVYRYAADPDFQILMAAWAIDDGPVQVAFTPREIKSIPGLWTSDQLKVAHNAQFERVCFSRFAVDHLNGEPNHYLSPEPWHDTAAIAAELGYPRHLDGLAKYLGGEQKDSAGKQLIKLFCIPNRAGNRELPEDHPAEWADFVDYCVQDVETLRDVDRRMGGWPTEMERRIFMADQRINDRGMAVDVPMATAAHAAAVVNKEEQKAEVTALTGVSNAGSTQQLSKWLRGSGLKLPNLRAETVEAALQSDLTDDQRRVLELRQDLALSASSKYAAELAAVCPDGRLRGGFYFFGAHTGRWAGRGVQPHNLPRAQLESETATDAAILDLMLDNGGDAHTLKALVRASFVGPFTVVDYSAIEARVIAWLAGEEWALEAFRAGRDIYVETAERMGGLTRAQGKVAVLALGYNGGVGSLRAMGAKGTDPQLESLVYQWRRANPSICRFWKALEASFRQGGTAGRVTVEKDGSDRFIRLPSGRAIAYRRCKFGERASFQDGRKGFRVDTYGGRLAENVTQAVARDILGEALIRLHEQGYDIVAHVHDEILVEGVGEKSVQAVSRLMTIPPKWADGLPIDAEGFTCARYRKG